MSNDIRQTEQDHSTKRGFYLQYMFHTSLKVIHDQKIAEALEHSRFFTEPKTQKPAVFQMVGTFLACFSTFFVQKPKATSPFCASQGEGTVS